MLVSMLDSTFRLTCRGCQGIEMERRWCAGCRIVAAGDQDGVEHVHHAPVRIPEYGNDDVECREYVDLLHA